MKKNIFFILIASAFLAVSCQKEHKIEFYDLGTEVYLSTTGMTSLDIQTVLTVENPLKNLSTGSIVHAGIVDPDDNETDPPSTDLGSVSISDGEGTATLTDSQLGISEIGWTANFELDFVFDGKSFTRPYHVTVDDPFSTEDPEITHRDDTTYYFQYAIEPVAATVSTVTIRTKVSSGGTYATVAGTWNPIDSVDFVGSNYNIGDTIYVEVTGTAGTKTATDVSMLVVSPYSYKNTNTFALDSTTNQAYDFMLARYVNTTTAGDSADIELTTVAITGGYNLGYTSNNNAEFVVAGSIDYSNADILQITSTDFTSAINSVAELQGGEVYIYRTRRGTGAYSYGIMKVTAVEKPGGVLNDSYIEIEYKN